jgi:hypothetical protein
LKPPDGERVIEVLALSPAAATSYLDVEDAVHGDVVRHCEGLGLFDRLA